MLLLLWNILHPSLCNQENKALVVIVKYNQKYLGSWVISNRWTSKQHYWHDEISYWKTDLLSETALCTIPVKNLSSQLTHCKLTWNLTASSFWSHSSTLQHIQEMISQLWPSCEWVLREFASPTLSLLWPISEINHWAHQAVVAVWTQWSNC